MPRILILAACLLLAASPRRPPRRPASVVQAAAAYGLNKRTVYRWIADGLLPAWKIGPKLIKVDLDDLDDLARPVPTADHGA